MAFGFIERVKAFITKPSKAFEKESKTTLKETLIYGLKGFLILAILYSIVYTFTDFFAEVSSYGVLSLPILFAMMLVGGFVGALVGSLWYHLWAYIFGARQGLKNTVKAVFFSETPTYILGWIPFVNIIVGIWSLVLLGIGLKKLQKLSTARAIGAVVIAVLIPIVISIAIMIWLIATYGSEILAGNQSTSTFSIPY